MTLGSVVRFSNCPETTMTITGFTIRNGFASSTGGGISITASNPLISHNLIMENVAQYSGGGIIIHGYTNPTIINNQIVGNVISTAGFEGGGICCYSGNALISFNTIYGNYADNGGAIYFTSGTSNTIISNNNIYENSAVYGGGIYIYGNSYAEVTDNTISDNDANTVGELCTLDLVPIPISQEILLAVTQPTSPAAGFIAPHRPPQFQII